MRDILYDVLKQVSGLASVIKVTGTAEQTRFQAVDEHKTVVIDAQAKSAIVDFQGVFGLSNLGLLQGLLDFASYRGEGSKLLIKRKALKTANDEIVDTVEQIEFRDVRGQGADFRCMAPKAVPDQATLPKIGWDVSFTPDRSKVTEFQKLVGLCKEVGEDFTMKIEDGALIFSIGAVSAATHRASMVFHDVEGQALRKNLTFNSAKVLKLLSVAGLESKLSISDRGLLSVSSETEYGLYQYYLIALQQ